MRILFIRHGDPDYAHDSLTDRGILEAKALAECAGALHMGDIYMSPLGRARKTASYTLEKLGKEAQILPWLEEFPVRIDTSGAEELLAAYPLEILPDGTRKKHVIWDILPLYFAEHPELSDVNGWRDSKNAAESQMTSVYDRIASSFDEFLAAYGYVRRDGYYEVTKESTETVTFFCHFGISAVLMSILMNISPFVPLQKFCLLPTSVTEFVTEERAPGIAHFRALRIGDLTHLALSGIEPSFAARYREVYSDTSHRN